MKLKFKVQPYQEPLDHFRGVTKMVEIEAGQSSVEAFMRASYAVNLSAVCSGASYAG